MDRKVHRPHLSKRRDRTHKCGVPPSFNLPPSACGGEWFRVLFERSADAMTLIDPESGRFIDCNPASAHAVGAEDRMEVLGLEPSSLAPEFQPDGMRSSDAVAEHIRR